MTKSFVHVDPRAQREFLQELNTRCYNIEKLIEFLESRLRLLGQDWRDAEYQAFVSQTRVTVRVLKAFIDEGRRVSRQLAESAQLAEEYQKIRS
jgi:hypothetical protein